MPEAITLHHGDCLDVLKTLEPDSVDSVVCDPPYELGFMGKAWDKTGIAFRPAVWVECLRVLKPGGHLLAFGGSRTFHRIAVAIEDAGFEIRDTIMWLYGSGFPKSHNISIAIDKLAGAEREVVGNGKARACWAHKEGDSWFRNDTGEEISPDVFSTKITAPATPAAAQWDGWGTALKPAHEPIILARKPLQGTVAENVLQWGTGGLNVDGCRVGGESWSSRKNGDQVNAYNGGWGKIITECSPLGRWPANIIHDGSAEVVAGFHETMSGDGKDRLAASLAAFLADMSAARFFYCAKASKADRDEGLEDCRDRSRPVPTGNHHPTVKPTALMRYLCRLVTPPGGIVLDPFMGSGSTGKAAILEGFRFVGIEREAEYLEIARARINHAAGMPPGGDDVGDSVDSDVGNSVESDVRTTRELSVQNPPKISRLRPIQARLL